MTWLRATSVFIAVAACGGLVVGLWLKQVRPAVYAGVVVAASCLAAWFVSARDATGPDIGWWAISVVGAMLAGLISLALSRAGISPTLWAVLVMAVALCLLVGSVGYHAGSTYARATVTTPTSSGASGFDPKDCNIATISSTHPDKPDKWAALGDSYSAGVGGELNGTAYGQDITNAFSWVGAAQLINPNNGDRFGLNMSACSGAVVRNLFHTLAAPGKLLAVTDLPQKRTDTFWKGLPDDLQTLKDAIVVTLTIGGNDAGFGNIAKTLGKEIGCANGRSCAILSDGGLANTATDGNDRAFSRNASPQQEWEELENRLEGAYAVTRTIMLHDARLFVVQYPMAFDKPQPGCVVAHAIGAKNMALINQFAAKLDATIAAAARAASKSTGLPIDVVRWGDEAAWATDSPRLGIGVPYSRHGLCSTDPWLNAFGPTTGSRTIDDSFHPTTLGAVAAGCALARQMYDAQEFLKFEGYAVVPSAQCPLRD